MQVRCRGVAKLVKASDFDSDMRRFESYISCQQHGLLVKWDNGSFASFNWEFDSPTVHQNLFPSSSAVEQQTVNLLVRGSIPRWGAK